MYRRFCLGEAYQHQYTCHPNFDLKRHENSCTVIWKGKVIADIPLAHTLSKQFSGACFTIASGPSLAEVDLQQLGNFQTISLNCAIKKFKESNLTPTHCIVVDHRVFENQWTCVQDAILSGAHCFFSYVGLSRICERAPELLKHGNIYLIESISRKFGVPRMSKANMLAAFSNDAEVFLDVQLPELCRSVGFCANLQKGVFSGKTVATWATQLAVALGYQQHFIIGMDLGGTGKKHFYADDKHAAPDFMRDYEPHIRACFEQAKRASLVRGFEVYNLSKNSTLPHEIMPKISLEEALNLVHTTHHNHL